MKQLPPSWGTPTLLECSQFVRGVTYTKSDAAEQTANGLLPIVRANNIQARRFEFNDLVYVPANLVSAEQVLKVGDVVVATSSGSISVVGKAAQVRKEQPMSFGAFCGVLRPSPVIHARYFGHFFSSKAYRDAVSDMARGVNINNLKRDHFQAIRIPLAPLAEQKRIVDKLDTVLTRVDAVDARLARVAPLLKRFRQSVLAAATSGRLTQDWRKVTSNVVGEFKQLGSMGSVIAGQSPSVSEVNRDGHGMPYVTGPEQWDGKKILAHKWTEYPKRVAPENSIFITVKGAGVGKTFPGCHAAIGRDIYAFVPSSEHLHKYVLFAIQASAEMVVLKAKGLIPGLTKADIAEQIVYVPSRDEQLEIVRRVETLFAFADRLEARLQNAQTAADRLTPSLLAKAFRGELVPQDPNDEPASELLKRLAAAPAALTRKRGSKTTS
jgi:type I restriction enzyme S subunit